jgi:hypothetical protein
MFRSISRFPLSSAPAQGRSRGPKRTHERATQPDSFASNFVFSLLSLCAAVLIPASALAVPMNVYFQGPGSAADPGTNFGIGLAQAIDARDNFGFDIVTGATGSSSVGTLGITQAPPTGFSSTPGTSTFNQASSDWTVQNVSGAALRGASYLVFTHTDPFTLPGPPVTDVIYPQENVGLTIDAADGWSIIMTSVGGTDYYYPALLLDRTIPNPLDGNLAAGASVVAEINYAVNQALIEIGAGSNVFALPELEIAFAQIVPEPGTATLLTLGLAGLASIRRKD